MRFGIYIRSLASARGAKQLACRLALGLAERGNQVDVLAEDDSGMLARRLTDFGETVTVTNLRRDPHRHQSLRLARTMPQLRAAMAILGAQPATKSDSGFVRLRKAIGRAVDHDAPLAALREYLDRNRPAGMLWLLDEPDVFALLASRLFRGRTRFVAAVHTPIPGASADPSSPDPDGRRQLIGRLFGAADAIAAPSSAIIDAIRGIKGVAAEKLHLIPDPAFEPQITTLAEESPYHPWFDPSARPVIVGIGAPGPQESLPILLRAFAKVRARAAVRLVVLGETGDQGELARLADELGIVRDVDFRGRVGNPYAFFHRAALFVLSSSGDGADAGADTVLVEAMACGCPAVSTEAGGASDILEGGRWGPLVPVGDVNALAAAMLGMLRSPTAPEDVVARAQVFSRAAAAERYEALLGGA